VLFTIGYEGRTLEELVAELRAHRIDRVIDVRELPLSRRKGFSKTPLGSALVAAGIEYVHLKQAGNPYRREEDALVKYRAHLASAEDAVDDVVEAARGHRAVLLCYERHANECHRTILAVPVCKQLGLKVSEL
jgi:uncharacterized protein (DUF488 family)